MKIRTCPNCQYQYSIWKYMTNFSYKLLGAKWPCKNCQQLLTFDMNRRLIVAIIAIIPISFAHNLSEMFANTFHTSFGISYAIVFTLLLIWAFYISSFDKFNLA